MEMTGLDPTSDRVCEIAVIRREPDGSTRAFQRLVRPPVPMGKGARKVHGITDEELAEAPPFSEVADEVLALLEGAVFVSHNVPFDLGFLELELAEARRSWAAAPAFDTLEIARRLFAFRKNNLAAVCQELGVLQEGAHRALADARATLGVALRMIEILDPEGRLALGELLDLLGALAPNSELRLRQQKLLREALEGRRTVWLDYQSTEGQGFGLVRREVAIWLLKLPYIQGWCFLREGERVFRLDRVRSLGPGTRAYEIPAFTARI